MSERYFIAAEQFCIVIEVPPSHSRAQVAGRIFDMQNIFENIRFKNRKRNFKLSCVAFYKLSVFAIVSRVHSKKHKLERKFMVLFQFLKKLCQKKRILTARNAYGNFVVGLYKVIGYDSLCKPSEKLFMEFFYNAFFASRKVESFPLRRKLAHLSLPPTSPL